MSADQVGWGCVTGENLRSLIDLHTAATDFTLRTPAIARAQASALLDHILRSVEQAAANKQIPGAMGKPTDRALFLIGHDTNLTTIGGLLGLTWIADGRRDDTPPGGSLGKIAKAESSVYEPTSPCKPWNRCAQAPN
jgi:4-phytase/acid phosphatase